MSAAASDAPSAKRPKEAPAGDAKGKGKEKEKGKAPPAQRAELREGGCGRWLERKGRFCRMAAAKGQRTQQ